MVYRTHSYTFQQSFAVGEARKGIETMVKEIREARLGEDGSYPIALTENKEFVFFSDIDKDGEVERVRYFLGTAGSGEETGECQTYSDGGSCNVNFSGFLQGELTSAEVKVSVDGDFGWNNQEYADIYADGNYLGRICRTGCSDCPDSWEGDQTFDVSEWAADDNVTFLADSNWRVNAICSHAMKAKFELSFTEEISGQDHQFKKGVINPSGEPASYPSEQEEIWTLSSYVRNAPPIFRYFDEEGQELTETPARLADTKMMEVYLIVNVDPNRAPDDFELRSAVQLRNLEE
jgi:hypothetical protein